MSTDKTIVMPILAFSCLSGGALWWVRRKKQFSQVFEQEIGDHEVVADLEKHLEHEEVEEQQPPQPAVAETSGSRLDTKKDENLDEKPDDLLGDLGHEKLIPAVYLENIPPRERQILEFLLDYIHWRKLDIDGILVNGGYVRDMLLGNVPDDLDISMCLQNCGDDITVGWILQDIPNFLNLFNEETLERLYGFTGYKSVDIQGDMTKNKQLDTAKAVFSAENGDHIEVDLMPTIGEEKYEDEDHRIPSRDQRGSPIQDALRRDLTIGAMLVKVTRDPETKEMEWYLLDYYNGLTDLKNGLLRAPFPSEIPEGVRILTEEDMPLAKAVGLDLNSPQELWWVKVLKDDPLRILRVFRFAAKLDFKVDPSFWKVIPFSLESLRSKVAGSRKLTEMVKLTKYGKSKLIDFFGLCFRKRFIYKADSTKTCLASAIFGGADPNGDAYYIPHVASFNKVWFKHLVHDSLPRAKSITPDQNIGAFLAVCIFCSDFVEEPTGGKKDMLTIYEEACDGLCSSRELREVGIRLMESFQALKTLEQDPGVTELDTLFGKRAFKDKTYSDLFGIQFAQFRKVWEVLRLSSSMETFLHDVVIGLFEASQKDILGEDVHIAELIRNILHTFQTSPPPKLSGKGVSQLAVIPNHLRGSALTHLQILCRLMGYDEDIDSQEKLTTFMETTCENLLTDLANEWYDSEGVLREKYQNSRGGGQTTSKKKKKNKNKKKSS